MTRPNPYHADLATFAELYGIQPHEAHVLPALFANAAGKVYMHPHRFLRDILLGNGPLGNYMAQAARKVAAECPRV